jgi:chromosome partitioning protein
MTTIVAIANQKGGVGKTTTAISLAHGLALKGKEVLLIDLDPQGQAAVSLGMKAEPGAYYLLTPPPGGIVTVKNYVRKAREGLWLVSGDVSTNASQAQMNAEGRSMSHLAEQLRTIIQSGTGLDFIVFDTAPSVGGIQERAIWASDLVLVPAATEFLSADGVRKIFDTMVRLTNDNNWKGKTLGILPTFYDEQTKESRSQMNEYQQVFKDLVLPPIHRTTVLRECPSQGRTIFEIDASSESAQRAVLEYQTVVEQVLKAAQ